MNKDISSFKKKNYWSTVALGLPGSTVVKNLPANAEATGLIPGLERSSGGVNGNPLQYPCQENLTDRRAWQAVVQGDCKKLDTTE